MKAKVFVTLKKSVQDPQGSTTQHALEALGFNGIRSVRLGKMLEVIFDDGKNKQQAEKELNQMCEKLLANTVIEDYRWELE